MAPSHVTDLEELVEIVGRTPQEEEEVEGEVVAGPSGEVVEYSSGNTPFIFPFFFKI